MDSELLDAAKEIVNTMQRLEKYTASKEDVAASEGRMKLFIDTQVSHKLRRVDAMEAELERMKYLIGIKI